MGTAEDKDTTEQDSKKLSEQEVGPIFLSTIHHFNSVLLYCLVYLLMAHGTLTTPILSSSEDASVKLRHLLTCFSALYQLSSFSSCCPVCFFPVAGFQCRASICTWEGSWQGREQGQLRGENRRWEGQDRVTLHKDRAICQPKRVCTETDRVVL